MTELHFRILIIPQFGQEPDIRVLQRHVEECGLIVHSILRVQLDKTTGPSHPEILEYIVDVFAENQSIISNNKKAFVYKELGLKWCQVTANIVGDRPVLQFYENECFFRKRKPCHDKIRIENISLGVQPKLGEYIAYSRLSFSPKLMAHFFHDVKEIEVITSIVIENRLGFYSRKIFYFVIKYGHIRNIFVDLSDNKFKMYLDLLHTPLFYVTHFRRDKVTNLKTFDMTRVLELGLNTNVAGKSNILKLSFLFPGNFLELLSCLRYRCNKIPISFVSMTTRFKTTPVLPFVDFRHFGCAYMWKAVTERTFTLPEQTENLNRSCEQLLRYSQENGDCLEKVLTILLFVIDSGRLVNYWNVIDILYASHMEYQRSKDFKNYILPSKCRLIRRVTLTPTRVLLWPPDLMSENRILRNFESDFFLRVTFRDDDFLTMNFRRYSGSVFNETVTKHMNAGLVIGERHYQMLAWSSSQLREHGVSMYAEDSRGRSAADIRRWTEIDPRTEMNIPKCLARIGQCFSQTESSLNVPLDNVHVRFEADIEGGFNPETLSPYTFSDGVGKISKDLMARVKKTFRQARECSALQIRYGGCKGMLVVDPSLTTNDIVFRESMKKFECRGNSHTNLEIAKKSGPIPLRLNRPLIAILDDLGVRRRIFLKLQEEMIQNLTDMLLDEEKATLYLNARTPFSDFKFKELSHSGIGLTIEPFFRTLLLALHRYYIDIIKTKANIDIDPNFARNMFGVLDETGILKYGQVFVQYSSDASIGISTPDDTKVLKGTVMVTKFPCVHPGDVRKFQAVDVPELHHIVDCIVFPRKGPRPHPDEMAGSDLDGDEYAVIWMKDLFFDGKNEEPAHYPKKISEQFLNVSDFLAQSKPEEIVQFLEHYIQNDQIGSIASAHLAMADQTSIFSDACLSIAAKHSVSVDFAKTGYSESLNSDETPEKYPDFMEKFYKKKYNSRKSLGKMYRVSKDFEVDNQATTFQYHNVQIDPTLVVDGWENFGNSAIQARNEYNNRLRTVIQTYGIHHETEAFGGAFIKLHPRFRERRDRAEIVTLVHTWLKELVEKTKKSFFEDANFPGEVSELDKYIQRKASAWYVVTYRESNPEFLSFPWVNSEILANIRIIKTVNTDVSLNTRTPLVLKLEEVVIKIAQDGMMPRLSPEVMFLLGPLHFRCDRNVVERALAILTKWGNEERIITTTHSPEKFLYYNTFIKLILHVAELEGYVYTARGTEHNKGLFTSAGLCISFFKYCMKLRFLNKPVVRQILPFEVKNYRELSTSAMVTFHSIAVTGEFNTLYYQEYLNQPPEVYDMKPVSIDISVFGISPIEDSKLRIAESILLELSGVEEVSMRASMQRKNVIVGAVGNHFTLQRLKFVLRKDTTYLSDMFKDRIDRMEE